jgi:hypothetical protein
MLAFSLRRLSLRLTSPTLSVGDFLLPLLDKDDRCRRRQFWTNSSIMDGQICQCWPSVAIAVMDYVWTRSSNQQQQDKNNIGKSVVLGKNYISFQEHFLKKFVY